MKAKSFDKKFDSDKEILDDLNLRTVRRPNQEPRRVNVDFPTWMVESLDREVSCLGLPVSQLSKFDWLNDWKSRGTRAKGTCYI